MNYKDALFLLSLFLLIQTKSSYAQNFHDSWESYYLKRGYSKENASLLAKAKEAHAKANSKLAPTRAGCLRLTKTTSNTSHYYQAKRMGLNQHGFAAEAWYAASFDKLKEDFEKTHHTSKTHCNVRQLIDEIAEKRFYRHDCESNYALADFANKNHHQMSIQDLEYLQSKIKYQLGSLPKTHCGCLKSWQTQAHILRLAIHGKISNTNIASAQTVLAKAIPYISDKNVPWIIEQYFKRYMYESPQEAVAHGPYGSAAQFLRRYTEINKRSDGAVYEYWRKQRKHYFLKTNEQNNAFSKNT